MSDAAPRALTAKLGPLPVWLWGALGAGVVALGRNLRGRRSTADAAPASDAAAGEGPAASAPEAGGPAMAATVPSLFPAIPANGYSDGASTAPAPTSTPDGWRRAGERWALDNLQWSGIVITSALQRYQEGAALNAADVSIVNAVIRAIGPAPDAPQIILQPGVDPGNAPTPPNSTPVTPAPAGPRSVTVPQAPIRRGDRGAKVTELQTELAALGLDPGPIDGVYGDRTQAAVLRLQRLLGMTGTTGREYGPIAQQKLTAYKLSH